MYRPNAPHPAVGNDGVGRALDALIYGLKELGQEVDFYNEHEKANKELYNVIDDDSNLFKDYDIVHFHTGPTFQYEFTKRFVRTLHWVHVGNYTVENMLKNDHTVVGVSKACMVENGLWDQGQEDVVHSALHMTDEQKAILPEAWRIKVENQRQTQSIGLYEKPYYVWLGGTDWFQEKGLDAVIQLAKMAGINLYIVGGGQYDAPLDFIKQNEVNTPTRQLKHLGMIDDPLEKYRILAGARALLYPTLIPDGCPMVVIEALCCGCPVFAYNHSSLPEIVNDGENGKLFEVGDLRSMTKFIMAEKTATTNELYYSEIAEAAQEKFSPVAAAKKYMDIFQRILDDG